MASTLMNMFKVTPGATTVTSYVFYSPVNDRVMVEDMLMREPTGTAHPWTTADGRKILLVNNGSGIGVKDITDDDPAIYINNAAISGIEEAMIRYFKTFAAHLGIMKDYSIQALQPGDIVTVPITNKITMFVATRKRDGNFFDFRLDPYGLPDEARSQDKNREILTYGNKKCAGLVHSGDKGQLLHFVSGFQNFPSEAYVVLNMVGYRKRQLRFFEDQLPVIFIADHDKQIIYTVPCPLDEATIGDASMSGLVVAKKSKLDTGLVCCVLPQPLTINGVDTNTVNATTRDAVKMAVEQADNIFKTPIHAAGPSDATSGTVDPTVDSEPHSDIDPITTDLPVVYCMIESGLTVGDESFGQTLHWGTGFSIVPDDSIPVRLPHIFGDNRGPAALALGHQPYGIDLVATDLVPTVAHVSTEMIDSVTGAATHYGNCIMIIHPKANGAMDAAISGDRKALENYINGININATCMTGPNAIVLVELSNGNRYWYRGVRWPKLLSEVPAYCDDVTYQLNDIMLAGYFASGPTFTWPIVMEKAVKEVHWNGNMMDAQTIVDHLSSGNLTIDQIKEITPDLLDILTQISVLLEPADIKNFRDSIDTALSTLQDAALGEPKAAYHTALMSMMSGDGDKDTVEGYRIELLHTKKAINRSLQKISNALENLVSVKGASSNNQNIKRRLRNTQIDSNVEKAKNMSTEDKIDLLSKYCEDLGILMANIDSGLLQDSLRAVAQSQFNTFIEGAGQLALMDPRMPHLDPDTVGSLYELTADTQSHPLFSQGTVAMPQGYRGDEVNHSTMPILLPDSAIKLRDPAFVQWSVAANEEQYAMWRILMRGAIADAAINRTTKLKISAASKDLGFLLIHMILSVMEDIVSRISTVPDRTIDADTDLPQDWDNTTCQMLRGLFGQLFALMASTKNILCTAFQFVYPNTNIKVLPVDQWWILSRVAAVYPYTCWDPTVLNKNIQIFIVKSCRKYLTLAATDEMTKAASKAAKVQIEKDPEWLAFLRLIVDTMFYAGEQLHAGIPEPLTADMAATLLANKPPYDSILSKGTKMMINTINQMLRYLQKVAEGDADFGDKFINTIQIAFFSYIKHANNISGEKKTLKNQIHSCVEVSDYVDLIDQYYTVGDVWNSTDDPEHANKLGAIIGTAAGSSSVPIEDMQITIPEPEPQTLAMVLAELPGSQKAVRIAERLDTLTLDQVAPKLPVQDLAVLMDITGSADHDVTLRQIIETLLEGWRDSVEAQNIACRQIYGHIA